MHISNNIGYLISIATRDLNLPKGLKDEMIESVSNDMFDIMRDSTSDIVELIDDEDNIEIFV